MTRERKNPRGRDLLGGIAIQLAAVSAAAAEQHDLYRYIWDGRVQAAGIDPYEYVRTASRWRAPALRTSGYSRAVSGSAARPADRRAHRGCAR